jgi:hypothetical protein
MPEVRVVNSDHFGRGLAHDPGHYLVIANFGGSPVAQARLDRTLRGDGLRDSRAASPSARSTLALGTSTAKPPADRRARRG